MTRKDFEAIARALRDARPIATADSAVNAMARNGINSRNHAIDDAAKNIADALADGNPRFDRARFLQACKTSE